MLLENGRTQSVTLSDHRTSLQTPNQYRARETLLRAVLDDCIQYWGDEVKNNKMVETLSDMEIMEN
jgi:hypothetical protein